MLRDRPPKTAALTPLLPRPPRVTAVPLLRGSDGEQRRLTGICHVGSAADNDWVIADPHVSQRHLTLVAHGDRVLVTDRESTNGTFLNGVRVREAELPEGGCLALGSTQIRYLRSEGGAGALARLLGASPAMERVRADIQAMAPSRLPILILGESGTGKELVARAVHEGSGRRGEFISINCGSLPRELIESDLFGHERGAFTGAAQRRAGCFREADGGTLFLDEIGELPPELQPRFLRALEVGAVRPVGSEREVPVDVRVIAATHRDLWAEQAVGHFREDLYYRLAALEVHLPPLRERLEDLPVLVQRFLQEIDGPAGPLVFDDEDLELLRAYPWPGNIRELRNAVARAAHLVGGPVLRAADLAPRRSAASRPYVRPPVEVPSAAEPPPSAVSTPPPAGSLPAPAPLPARRLEELERDAFVDALQRTGNNRRAAALLLGIPKSTLCDKLKRLGIG